MKFRLQSALLKTIYLKNSILIKKDLNAFIRLCKTGELASVRRIDELPVLNTYTLQPLIFYTGLNVFINIVYSMIKVQTHSVFTLEGFLTAGGVFCGFESSSSKNLLKV